MTHQIQPKPPIEVLILSGSSRKISHTETLSVAIVKALESRGVKVTSINLASAELPPADPAYHKDPTQNPDPRVKHLVDSAIRAHAFVLLTPIYHNSYSAILKNALDNLAVQQFTGKPVALGSHGNNRNTQAVDHLRIVVRGLNGLAITAQVCTGDDDYSEQDNSFTLTAEPIFQRIERQADELMRLTNVLNVA